MSAKRAAFALLQFDEFASHEINRLQDEYKEGGVGILRTASDAVKYLRSIYTLAMCASAANVPENAVIAVILFDDINLGTMARCREYANMTL